MQPMNIGWTVLYSYTNQSSFYVLLALASTSEQVPKFLNRNEFYVLPTGNWSLWPGLNPRPSRHSSSENAGCVLASQRSPPKWLNSLGASWRGLKRHFLILFWKGLGNCSLSRWNLNNMQIIQDVAAVYHVLDLFIIFFHDYIHHISV